MLALVNDRFTLMADWLLPILAKKIIESRTSYRGDQCGEAGADRLKAHASFPLQPPSPPQTFPPVPDMSTLAESSKL